MTRLNIHEAKTHLSRYLSKMKAGDVIVLCRRNVPIAEIRALTETRRRPPKLGTFRGRYSVPPSFFEPLPAEVLDAFEGRHD